ncbi:MAG: hypothetical protein AB9842_12840 [Bacteroidales bacterium]
MLLFFFMINNRSNAQKILILEKAGTVNNYKYRVNEPIYLKIKSGPDRFRGTISRLSDSTLILDYIREIKYSEVTDIYRPMWVKHWLPELLIKASIGYFVVVSINNILQHVYPVLPGDLLITTATLAGSGLIFNKLLEKHYHLDKGWRIRLLDFDQLK